MVVGCQLSSIKKNSKFMNKDYIDLEVWQECRKLTNLVYALTKLFPKEEQFGLINQIRRDAVSVSSNIAEGCGRQTAKDTINFLHISRGSLYEVETQCFVALDQNYISKEQFDDILKRFKFVNDYLTALLIITRNYHE